MPACRPASRRAAGRATEGALDAVAALKPVAPPGTRFVYSDVNFIVLGELVRRVSGSRSRPTAPQHIFQPLGMHDTGFRPPTVAARAHRAGRRRRRRAALGRGARSDRLSHGRRRGSRRRCSRPPTTSRSFAQMLLEGGTAGGVRISGRVRRGDDARRRARPAGAALRGLGWDIDSPYAVWLAPSFSTRSYGHTGYTGTALWIDPESTTFLIVLTNRLHPDGKGNILPMLRRIAERRGRARRAAQRRTCCRASTCSKPTAFAPLAGRRVGLITNQIGARRRRTADGRRAAPGAGRPKLVALFSPEHGLDARREGKIASGPRPATGLPIYSLYGEHLRPTRAMLDRPRCAGVRHAGRRARASTPTSRPWPTRWRRRRKAGSISTCSTGPTRSPPARCRGRCSMPT